MLPKNLPLPMSMTYQEEERSWLIQDIRKGEDLGHKPLPQGLLVEDLKR